MSEAVVVDHSVIFTGFVGSVRRCEAMFMNIIPHDLRS